MPRNFPFDGETQEPVASDTITCIECSGTAHRMGYPPEEGFSMGDVVTYLCEDCGHRMDVVVEEDAGLQG